MPTGPFMGAIVQRGAALTRQAGGEPAAGGGVGLEEVEQHGCDLLHPRLRGVRPVLLDVVAGPDEPVPTAAEAVRPEVWVPPDPGFFQPAGHAVLDQPPNRVAAVVGRRLRIEADDRV